MQVVRRTKALAYIARITAYIAADNPVAAARIARARLLAGDNLTLFPRRGRPGRHPNIRELATVPPYIIVYRIQAAETVTILRIWHAAQRR
jgi:toxin ParE1/3/4